MTAYLLDTNVISELARERPDPADIALLERESDVCVSVIFFEELTFGCERASQAKRTKPVIFVDELRVKFGARAIPVDLAVAKLSGQLRGLASQQGRVLNMAEALIAATAKCHPAVLVTRNVRDFEVANLELRNPFKA